MPSESFDRAVTVSATPTAAWETVTNVDQLVSWIEILSSVEEEEPLTRYTAVLSDRIGPFSLNADLAIDVTDLDEGRSISLRAEGKDRAVDSRIFIEGTLTVSSSDGETRIAIDGHYEVTGRVAKFGGPMIRARADDIVNDFFEGLSGALS